jgi:hypothetical protein
MVTAPIERDDGATSVHEDFPLIVANDNERVQFSS